MTIYAEVIGDPIAQSKSPMIHGFWIKKLGLDADYRATHVTSEQLGRYLAERQADNAWRGCNVTMPHKQAVQPFLDSIDETATAIGAVNTIYPAFDRQLAGTNTDMAGFLEPLREKLARQHLFRMARVIGTGGAARAIVAGLTREGFTIVLAGRDRNKARRIIDELDPGGEHHVAALNHFATRTDFVFDDREGCCDLVINATSSGMRGQPSLAFDWSHAPPRSIAYDIVTDPVETDFLKDARDADFMTIDGTAMLIGQAAIAFTHFFGVQPPREHDAELREKLAG